MHTTIPEVIQELRDQSKNPPGADKYIAAFSGPMADFIDADPNFGGQLASMINRRSSRDPFTPTYAANFILRLTQLQLLGQPDYPEAYDKPEVWRATLADMLDDPAKQRSFASSLSMWDVGSNIVDRAKAYRLASSLYQDHHNMGQDGLQIMDVGCSRNHVLYALNQADYLFDPPYVFSNGSGTDHPSEVLQQDKELRERISARLGAFVPLGECVGIDPWPLRDPEMARWKLACSFYPQELMDKSRVRKYIELDEYDAPNIDFVDERFDIKDTDEPNSPPLESLQYGQEFDLVTFSTVWYQVGKEKRRAMLDNALAYAKPDGWILVQDFVDIRPDQADPIDQLEFPSHWFDPTKPFRYRTLIYDKAEPESGFQELFRWMSGRCQQLKLGRHALHLGQR